MHWHIPSSYVIFYCYLCRCLCVSLLLFAAEHCKLFSFLWKKKSSQILNEYVYESFHPHIIANAKFSPGNCWAHCCQFDRSINWAVCTYQNQLNKHLRPCVRKEWEETLVWKREFGKCFQHKTITAHKLKILWVKRERQSRRRKK